MGRAIFAAALSLVFAGLGHFVLGFRRRVWLAMPSAVLRFLPWANLWEFADVVFLSLGIVAAFDAFSFARHRHGII